MEALAKYLLALGTSFSNTPKSAAQISSSSKKEVSVKRKRLHILYLIHDLIHHTKLRGGDERLAAAFEPYIPALFSTTAQEKGRKHAVKIDRLIDIWSSKGYYPGLYMDDLRKTVHSVRLQAEKGSAATTDEPSSVTEENKHKEKPYDMPATHGDYTTTWYDLPAANLMQHIIPNSTRPIKGSLVEPLRFTPGPADPQVAAAVKALIDDSHSMWGESEEGEDAKYDLDALGQRIVTNEMGNRKVQETYYGWSEEFARKMTRKRKARKPPPGGGRENSVDRDRYMDRSYSSERSMSPPTGPRLMGLGGDRPRGGDGGRGYGDRGSRSRTRSRSASKSRGRGYGVGGGYQGGNGGYAASMGPPRGRGRSSRSATPDDMPRGLGY